MPESFMTKFRRLRCRVFGHVPRGEPWEFDGQCHFTCDRCFRIISKPLRPE